VLDLLCGLVVRRLSRLAVAVALSVVVFGVGYTLAFGTDALMAGGLSRRVAGSTVTVVAGCLYGLYWFATVIDW
jgi:hypothetical protein